MIVPMKKLSLLIFHKDYRSFLDELRDKGVVHIHENKKHSADDERLKQKIALVKRIGELLKLMARRVPVENKISPDVKDEELPGFLEERFKRIEQIGQQIALYQKDCALFEPWGEFSRDKIDGLNRAGWDMRFFIAPDKKYMPEWEDKYNAFVVNQEKGQKYFITVGPKGAGEQPDADAFEFPSQNKKELAEQIQQLENEAKQIADYLDAAALDSTERLKNYRLHLYEDTDELKIEGATSTLIEERVIAIEGWIPAEIRKDTDTWLSDKGVYYSFEEPTLEDNPPIKLKNNKFAKLFEFIGELYSLPNYREFDLTPFFAPFFLLFFGFCLGDAGYGLLLLVGISIYKIKAKPSIKPILSLAQWLGFATVVMGIVSGTFFGIQLMNVEIPWVVKFRSIMLDSQQLFNLALIIGVVQIIFGMFLKVANLIKQYGVGAAVSTMGWLVLILGEGTCYLLSTKGFDLTIMMYVIGAIGGSMVLIFNNLRRNVFINVGAGLWDTYNMLTGLLGDTLSYIRLFALGISSSVLGLVFNDLAVNMSGDIPVVKQLVMLLILVFGHSINLFMAGLGSFVHPMRLTFVEFYKNAGFEGGGKKYQPFKKRMNN